MKEGYDILRGKTNITAIHIRKSNKIANMAENIFKRLLQMIKSRSFKKIFAVVLSSMIILAAADLFIIKVIIPSTPAFTAGKYIELLNKRDYREAIKYYIDIPYGMMVKENDIINVLKQKYDNTSNAAIKKITDGSGSGTKNIDIVLPGKEAPSMDKITLYNTKSSFLGLKREWKVIFPFKLSNLCINSIDGTEIYIDGTYAGTVKAGSLNINGVIFGIHDIKANLSNMASNKETDTAYDIEKPEYEINIDLTPDEDFKSSAQKLIFNFCKGWSDYCLTQKSDYIKQYLSDKLYKEYMKDTERFNGSKYQISDFKVNFKDLSFTDEKTACYSVDETWHLKEVITGQNMIFQANGEKVLEQNQYISWKYFITNEQENLKIFSTQQVNYRQEIKK